MKTQITVIALALASFGAYAQKGYDNQFRHRTGPTQVETSALTRDAVRADLLAAIARGERFPDLQASRTGPTEVMTSVLTREQVRADVLAAIEAGKRVPNLQASRTGPSKVGG
jgi:Domain of unknown function (DUF4148)